MPLLLIHLTLLCSIYVNMSGPKETEDKWLTISISKPFWPPASLSIASICYRVHGSPHDSQLITLNFPPLTLNFSSSWASLSPASHYYIALPFHPRTLFLLSWFLVPSLGPLLSLLFFFLNSPPPMVQFCLLILFSLLLFSSCFGLFQIPLVVLFP